MEPENTPLEKESIIFQTIIFRFDLLIFRDVTHISLFFFSLPAAVLYRDLGLMGEFSMGAESCRLGVFKKWQM